MNRNLSIDFSNCQVVDYLWPQFVDRLGFNKTKKAVDQVLDLQRMNGTKDTIPVLIVETCGIALARIQLLYIHTGILCDRENMILVLSIKENLLQIISEL